MWSNIKRKSFPVLIALAALSVSGTAAFYSVTGLSKLFAGASFAVILMASALEFSKLITASLLYQYWNTLNKTLRTYLTGATVVLVLITSMGIYGFLSAAYQDTYQSLTVTENKIKFLEEKERYFKEELERHDQELNLINENIKTLSSAKSQQIQIRDTSSSTGYRQTISTTELRLAQERIKVEEENKQLVSLKRTGSADSLQKYRVQILELKNSAETVGELGPLKYLAGVFNKPMDKIINILLLVIIFVFDPLAISLVLAANHAFTESNRTNIYGEPVGREDTLPIYEDTPEESKPVKEVLEPEINSTENQIIEKEPEGEKKERENKTENIKRILQKSPTQLRILTEEGEQKWIPKKDVKREGKRYM